MSSTNGTSMHPPAVPLAQHPATLPTANISAHVNHVAVAEQGVNRLHGLQIDDLTDNAIWRDLFALTGTLRTFFGPQLFAKTWDLLGEKHKPTAFKLIDGSSHVARFGPTTSWVEARFEFRIDGPRPAQCSGTLGLVPAEDDPNVWKIWLLCTLLERPDGYPDVDGLRPVNQLEARDAASSGVNEVPAHVDCAVIGGGVAGLTMAGRLQALGLSYVVIEKDANVGDVWTKHRYSSVKLHTSKHFNQLSGNPPSFLKEDPYHLPAIKIADGFQRYVETFGIRILLSTTLESAAWDENSDGWLLTLSQDNKGHSMRARHVVMATGNVGTVPNVPEYADRHLLKGDVVHGMHWKNAEAWRGKRGVVIGSANTAHDVIADMAKAGLKPITMIQRGKTFLLPVPTFAGLTDPVYNEETPIELSDRLLMSYPLPVLRLVGMRGVAALADQQKEYFDRVEATGFNVERYGDLWGLLYDREGGHFFDLGASDLLVDGTVKVRSGAAALPVAYTENGLRLKDGSELEADVVVFATGYSSSIRSSAEKLFGQKIGQSLRESWQCDGEGEVRGAWRHTGHPRIWYTGHGYAYVRFYSRFVALHIKSEVDGRPMEMYME